jgi:hypothetical protein
MTDWRLQGQEKYLQGAVLERKAYQPYRREWEHDHCEFCSAEFSLNAPDALREGYATSDHYRWVCAVSYEDFQEMLGLRRG